MRENMTVLVARLAASAAVAVVQIIPMIEKTRQVQMILSAKRESESLVAIIMQLVLIVFQTVAPSEPYPNTYPFIFD